MLAQPAKSSGERLRSPHKDRKRQEVPLHPETAWASPSIAREVTKFVAASLAASLLFMAASVPLLRQLGKTEALREVRDTAHLAAAGVIEPNLTDELLEGDPQAVARMDRAVQERVLGTSIVRVKIWAADGRIVYADEPRLIGSRFGLDEEERDVLVSGDVVAELSDLDNPENRYERSEGELLEVYSRVRTPSGTPVLFELYRRWDSVLASGRRIWLSFLPPLLGALALLWLVQLPLAYRLACRLRRTHEERELLLRRALDASNDERRRIAGDLHDDVVQDLAGLSYSLAAAAEMATPGTPVDPDLRGTLREHAAIARGSVQRLRSMLLAIHPPNLRVSGLNAALADLVAPLRRSGLETEVHFDAGEVDLETEALVFRTAREAIRNVLDHAEARRAAVTLQHDNGTVRLEVEDNGVGFDAGDLKRRQREGHVGLSLLQELAAHANARLDIRSAPGKGTAVTLEVPT